MNVYKPNQQDKPIIHQKVCEYHLIDGRYFRVESQPPWCMVEIEQYENKGTSPVKHQNNKGDFKKLKKAHEKARVNNI